MLDKQYGNIIFRCDDCEEAEFETDCSNFQDALDTFKNDTEGSQWVSYKEGDQWRHTCPECSKIIA